MGKRIRNYSIFVLFLLMSMSVFAAVNFTNGSVQAAYEDIVLTFNGNTDTMDSIINFKESTENDSETYKNLSVNNGEISYKSLLNVSAGDKVNISFTSIEEVETTTKEKVGKEWIYTTITTEEETNFTGYYSVSMDYVSPSTDSTGTTGTAVTTTDTDTTLTDETVSNGNGISVDIISVVISSTNPITFKLVIKSRTGDKFDSPVGYIENILIKTNTLDGNNTIDTPVDANLVYVGEVVGSPKTVTTFNVLIQTAITDFSSYDVITISGDITITDPDGNVHAINGKEISFGPILTEPNGTINLLIHENLTTNANWVNGTTGITGSEKIVDGYIFTKGGPDSLEIDPGIYITGSTGEGIGQIGELIIKKNGGVEERIDVPFGEKIDFSMQIGDFIKNCKNIIKVKPVSVLGVEGALKDLYFVIDTEINDSKLGDGIIGELENKKIVIDLKDLVELSGINGYSYKFKVGEGEKSGDGNGINKDSFTVLDVNSTDEVVEISTSGLIGGSKGTLLFTVYDKLGHEKTFEKAYFIPKEVEGVTAKIKGEVKNRSSRIKVVTEGSTTEKFGIASNVEGSSESE